MHIRRLRILLGVAACLAALAPSEARPQAGALDPTFSGDGKVFTNSTSGDDYAADVAVQPSDGKIVAVGLAGGRGGRIALVRYESDGTLDPSFGSSGKVFTNLSPGDDWVAGIEIQADGKIVVAGRSGSQGGMIAVVRYNPDGGLDPSFSDDGKAAANFSSGDDFAFGVALQPDGSIVAAGRAGGAGGRLALVRYTDEGDLDPSFSGDGRLAIDLTPGDDRLDHVAIQASGQIVAAGTSNYFTRQARFAVIRLMADGTPDPTFGGDGRVTTNLTNWFDGAFGVALQPGGEIMVSGQANHSIGLARYEADGTLDTSFSSDGKVITNLTPGVDYAEELEIQTDTKIVVAGTVNYFGQNPRFVVARYDVDGRLDPLFSGDGKEITDMTPGFEGAFGLALQPADQKIVAAGYGSGQGGRFAIARYLGA